MLRLTSCDARLRQFGGWPGRRRLCGGYHAGFVEMIDLDARWTRRWRNGRRERPFRFLLDGGLFRSLCAPGQAAALDNFRVALGRLGFAADSRLPDLEMTPLAILDVIGVEPPRLSVRPRLPGDMAALETSEIGTVINRAIQRELEKAPELKPARLRQRVDELRQATDPAAHELFDLCLTRFVARDKFEEDILEPLIFDAFFTFRFPEEVRARMTDFLNSSLLEHSGSIAGLSKVRRLKVFWDRSLERILKKHPMARGDILAVDQEMRPRMYGDFLGWEVIHYAVLGYGRGRRRLHPVIAFSPEPEERLRARCRAHKTALRAFLDEISPAELAGDEVRPRMTALTPGWLVPCRADGTVEAPMSTGEVPVWAGPSLRAAPASLPGGGEG